jgi:hypothetical protein
MVRLYRNAAGLKEFVAAVILADPLNACKAGMCESRIRHWSQLIAVGLINSHNLLRQ